MIMLKDATCATGRASDTRRLGTPLAAPPLAPAAPPTRYYRYAEIFAFLDAVDLCGKSIPTKVQDHPDRPVDTEKCNVSFEARLIKKMYIRLQHA